jgi:anaerobic magnesium-protoporphyrin IX monomethyl ester cyclase
MNKSIAWIYLPHPWLKEPEAQLPLGILYLASVTNQAGFVTYVYNYSGWTFESAINDLTEHDFFAITVTSLEIPMANRFGRAVKKAFPNSKLLIGGPGTITPDFINDSFDLIFIGEGEEQIVRILSSIHFLSYPIVHINGTAPKELDKLPFPARGQIQNKLGGNIFAFGKQYTGSQSTTILSSRGCPYHCAFCSAPRSKVRFRDPGWVVAEMLYVYKRYGVSQFRFSDDTFTLDRNRVLQICKGIRNNFNDGEIAWRVSCRVKPIDDIMVSAMVEAGCKEFSFGIESFDQNVLNRLCKGVTVEDNINALKTVHRCGGKARVLFMIRTPGQSPSTVQINIDTLETVPYEIIACTTFAPLPGSAIWDHPNDFGIKILSRNLSEYNFYFYNKEGRNKIKRLFEYNDQDTELIEQQSEEFRTYLESTGKLNKG